VEAVNSFRRLSLMVVAEVGEVIQQGHRQGPFASQLAWSSLCSHIGSSLSFSRVMPTALWYHFH
jgi:hypothetical protein